MYEESASKEGLDFFTGTWSSTHIKGKKGFAIEIFSCWPYISDHGEPKKDCLNFGRKKKRTMSPEPGFEPTTFLKKTDFTHHIGFLILRVSVSDTSRR